MDKFYSSKFAEVLDNIHLTNGWKIHLRQDSDNGRYFYQVIFFAKDNCNILSEPQEQHCRKWYLTKYMTVSELVRTAWLAFEQAVIHEAQEQFLYKHAEIYNPHRNVEYLVSISDKSDVRN